jgi:hypothetical protein
MQPAPEPDTALFSLRIFPRAAGKILMVPGSGGCGQHKEAARARYRFMSDPLWETLRPLAEQ